MTKFFRAIIFLILIVGPIVFYSSLNKKSSRFIGGLSFGLKEGNLQLPSIALIFDDLGESLSDLKEIYSLGIPLTISVIPNLKFSKNIAHIAARCGFTVFIHLPLEPKKEESYETDKYQFISGNLTRRENESLLRKYLNSIRIAIGVNNHMGSKATEDPKLMDLVIQAIKKKGLIFVDSQTSAKSVAYSIACQRGLICGYNEGFLDAIDDIEQIEKRMKELLLKAKEKGKIIIIAHPRKNTINFLKKQLPILKKKVKFITIKEYFAL